MSDESSAVTYLSGFLVTLQMCSQSHTAGSPSCDEVFTFAQSVPNAFYTIFSHRRMYGEASSVCCMLYVVAEGEARDTVDRPLATTSVDATNKRCRQMTGDRSGKA